MPRISESDAFTLASRIDELSEDQKPQALDLLTRYRDQQDDLGEPHWPSQAAALNEARQKLRQTFTGGLDAVPANISPFSDNPKRDRAIHANLPFLAQRYGKTGQEIADRYEFYRNDYAARNFGQFKDVTDEGFYGLVAGEIQNEIADEQTELDGRKAALRGEDAAKALMSHQASNMGDRQKMLKSSRLFTQGYLQGQEIAGENLPLAEELFGIMESRSAMTKNDGATRPAPDGREQSARLSEIVQEMAAMKPRDRKRIYSSITARIEAAGHDPKGFWAQSLGELGRNISGMGDRVSTKATEAGIIAQSAPVGIATEFDFQAPEMSDEARRDMEAAIALNDKMGVVRDEIAQIVSGQLDPLRPTVGWLNDKVEMGLMRAPGAVLPYMTATMVAGPWGAGALAYADFAEQNRLSLIRSGIDPQDAKRIGVIAAPFQAGAQTLANMLQLGRFPAATAFLSKFTAPVGGASLIGRYLQNSGLSLASEFSEEQLQDNVIVPLAQNFAAAIDKDVPTIGMGQIWENIKASSPDLLFTLAPMALVFGGVMTAADAKLSEVAVNTPGMGVAMGYSQAQENTYRSEPTTKAKIAKAGELWGKREGTKTTMEAAAKSLSERLRMFQTDALAAQQDLERRGILPRVLHTAEDSWRLTFNDGSIADYGTHEEASNARWQWTEDQLGKFHQLTRDTLNTLEKNLEANREIAPIISPDVKLVTKADAAANPDLQERLDQADSLGDIQPSREDTMAIGKATGTDDEILGKILGSSTNSYKDGILTTTIKLYEGATVLTLVEEKLEGDAKAIIASEAGRKWMLDHLQAYERDSGDKLFHKEDITNKMLVEAWSHLGQSYLVGRSTYGEPLQSKAQRRFGKLLMRSGLSGAVNAEAVFFANVAARAQKLVEIKKAGKLPEDLAAELERQLGLDYSQARHEAGAAQEAEAMAKEGGGDAGETFSIGKGDFESRMAAAFSPFQKSPELRVAVAQVAKQRALKLGAEWIEKAAEMRAASNQQQGEAEIRHAESVAKLREDLESDEAQIRQERDFELDGVTASKGTELDRERIRREADNKLKTRRIQFERELAAVDQRLASSETKSAQKDASIDRTSLKAALRTLDGILAAAPPEVRAKVGGYVKLAGLATDEAMLREIENRVAKLNVELEKWLVKEGRGQLKKILSRAAAKKDSGEKAQGKLGAEGHAWFSLADAAAHMSPAEADKAIAAAEDALEADVTDAQLAELSAWLGRPVTDLDEARDLQNEQLTILQTFGSTLYGTDAQSPRNASDIHMAVEVAKDRYVQDRFQWLTNIAERRERRKAQREAAIGQVGGAANDDARREQMAKEGKIAGLTRAAVDYIDSGLDVSGFLRDLLGDSEVYGIARRSILSADAAEQDGMRARREEFHKMLAKVFKGGRTERLRKLWELQKIQKGPVGTMSQLQAMQLTMWHADLDSQEWLNEHGYGPEWQAKAEEWLTPEAKQIRAWLMEGYTKQYDRINRVFRSMRGVNLPRVDNYGGMRLVENMGKDAGVALTEDTMIGGLNAGFSKTRISSPKGPPKTVDALTNYWSNAMNVEHYIAWGEVSAEMRAVLGHRDFRLAVEASRGQTKARQLMTWLESLEKGGQRNAIANTLAGELMQRWGSAASASALLFKIGVLFKQSAAMFNSAFKTGLPAYARSLQRVISGKGSITLADVWKSDTIKRRINDYEPEMRQAMQAHAQRRMESEILDTLTQYPARALEGGWYAIGWTDAVFTTVSAAVAHDVAFQEAKKMGASDAEARAYADEEMSYTVKETAQADSVATKSLFENQVGHPWLRLIFAFQGPNRQAFALTYRALKTGELKGSNLALSFLIIPLISQTIGGLMRMATSDDDKEEVFTLETYLTAILTGPLTGALQMGPVIEFLSSAAGYAAEQRTGTGPAGVAGAALNDIAHGDFDVKDVGNFITGLGILLGGRASVLGPVWNVARQALGFAERIEK